MKIKSLFLCGVKKIFPSRKNVAENLRKKTVAQGLQSDWYKIGKDFSKVLKNYGRT